MDPLTWLHLGARTWVDVVLIRLRRTLLCAYEVISEDFHGKFKWVARFVFVQQMLRLQRRCTLKLPGSLMNIRSRCLSNLCYTLHVVLCSKREIQQCHGWLNTKKETTIVIAMRKNSTNYHTTDRPFRPETLHKHKHQSNLFYETWKRFWTELSFRIAFTVIVTASSSFSPQPRVTFDFQLD